MTLISTCRASRTFRALLLGGALLAAAPVSAQSITRAASDISSLGAVDPFSVPAVSGPSLPQSSRLWRGSDAEAVDIAMQAVMRGNVSGVWRRAAIDILAQASNSPTGDRDAQLALAETRLKALETLGRDDLVARLFERTAGLNERESLARRGAGALLDAGRLTDACDSDDRLAEQSVDPFWVRLRIACLALAGEAAAAEVTLNLASDQRLSGVDAAFRGYIDALTGAAATAPALNPRNPLERAIRAHLNLLASAAPPSLNVNALFSGDTDPQRRAEFARDLVREGTISATEYARVIREVALPEDAVTPDPAIGAPVSDAGPITIPAGYLARHQIALNEAASDARRVAVLSALIREAGSFGEMQGLGVLYRDVLDQLPAEAGEREAVAYARLAATAGDLVLARRWRDIAENGAPQPVTLNSASPSAIGSPSLQTGFRSTARRTDPAELAELDSWLVVADPSSSQTSLSQLARQRLAVATEGNALTREAARRDIAVLLAMGAEPDPALWRATGISTGPSAAFYWADAVGATGEALLHALADAAMRDGQAIYAISQLRKAGLDRHARDAALATMLEAR